MARARGCSAPRRIKQPYQGSRSWATLISATYESACKALQTSEGSEQMMRQKSPEVLSEEQLIKWEERRVQEFNRVVSSITGRPSSQETESPNEAAASAVAGSKARYLEDSIPHKKPACESKRRSREPPRFPKELREYHSEEILAEMFFEGEKENLPVPVSQRTASEKSSSAAPELQEPVRLERRVSLDLSAAVHNVIPYSEVYGLHPRDLQLERHTLPPCWCFVAPPDTPSDTESEYDPEDDDGIQPRIYRCSRFNRVKLLLAEGFGRKMQLVKL